MDKWNLSGDGACVFSNTVVPALRKHLDLLRKKLPEPGEVSLEFRGPHVINTVYIWFRIAGTTAQWHQALLLSGKIHERGGRNWSGNRFLSSWFSHATICMMDSPIMCRLRLIAPSATKNGGVREENNATEERIFVLPRD